MDLWTRRLGEQPLATLEKLAVLDVRHAAVLVDVEAAEREQDGGALDAAEREQRLVEGGEGHAALEAGAEAALQQRP